MKHYGDIKELSGYDLPIVDVITGGSPCQDLSIAGKMEGLNGSRSKLFFEQIRIVKEMRECDRASGRADVFVRPRYMVWENVPPFGSNGGKDFQTVLTEIVRIAEPDAPDVPMPNRGGGKKQDISMMKWADGQFRGESMTRNTGEFRKDENGLLYLLTSTDSQRQKSCLTLNIGLKPRETFQTKIWQILEESPDLKKYKLSPKACRGILNRAKKKGRELPKELEEALIIQSGGGFVLEGNGTRQSHNGDGFAQSDIMYTLNTVERHAVYQCFEPRSQDGVHRINGDISPTLNTAEGGQRQPCIFAKYEN